MAPQLTATKGLFARGLLKCKALATISLPVPLSPRMSTEALYSQIFLIVSKTWSIISLLPIMLPKE